MKVTKDFLLHENEIVKKKIKNSLSLNKKIRLIQYNAYLEWKFPFNHKFSDSFLENEIVKISNIIHEKSLENRPNDSDVFIASFLMDNGALFQQYIEFLYNKSKDLLLIVTENFDELKSKDTLEYIKQNNIKHVFLRKDNNPQKKVIQIIQLIEEHNPSRIWAHLIPNDIAALLSIKIFNNSKKYYIVGNDHTFWLGKNIFDYFIEFRHFGISLAIERRGIPLEKILHIPFYPIKNEEPFIGFPFERKNKIVGISGANLYKYLMDPELHYFKAIKELIVENPNFMFCLCGNGDSQTISQFIEKNNLQDRFFFLGHRTDFYNLIGQSDILFESYPMKGGLTPLFATEQKIPVVGIASYDNISGSLEEMLNIEGYKQPANFNEFKAEASLLINNPEYRIKLGNLLSNNACNKKDFESALVKVLNEDLTTLHPKVVKPLRLNDEANLQEYLNLKDSTIENQLRIKLFTIKSSLPISSRLKLMIPTINASNTKGLYAILRVIFLALWGR